FFSSRRRHTSSDRDWSSDVCSSDLAALMNDACAMTPLLGLLELMSAEEHGLARVHLVFDQLVEGAGGVRVQPIRRLVEEQQQWKIGRASCRERGSIEEVPGCLETKR